MHNHTRGLLAEYIVIIRYILKGYFPIKHRWKSKMGEIDIILKRGKSIIFCEVKARSSDFNIENPVSYIQKQRIIKSAEYFIAINRNLKIKNTSFDLAIVKSIFDIKLYKGWIGW